MLSSAKHAFTLSVRWFVVFFSDCLFTLILLLFYFYFCFVLFFNHYSCKYFTKQRRFYSTQIVFFPFPSVCIRIIERSIDWLIDFRLINDKETSFSIQLNQWKIKWMETPKTERFYFFERREWKQWKLLKFQWFKRTRISRYWFFRCTQEAKKKNLDQSTDLAGIVMKQMVLNCVFVFVSCSFSLSFKMSIYVYVYVYLCLRV